MNKCVFCQNNRFENNQKIGFTFADSLIYSNEYVFVTPDISPLTAGHLLIVSQDHYNSFADAPLAVKNALFESLRFIRANLGYDEMIWFEHGAVFPGQGGASVNHAHVHVLPITLPIREEVEKDHLYSAKEVFSMELFNYLSNRQSYLWISDGNQTSNVFFVDDLPSQYLRRIAMSLQGENTYDWKSNYSLPSSRQKYIETLSIVRDRVNNKE